MTQVSLGTVGLQEHEKTRLQHLKKHSDDKHIKEQPTVNYGTAKQSSEESSGSRPWTNEEQKMLEKALQTYPPSWTGEGDRWDMIASMVEGRTKKECKQRVKVKGR